MRARIGAHAAHARHGGHAMTAAARAKFMRGFEAQVDPRGELPPDERARRAEQLRKAHFARLALKSVQARRRRAKT